MIDKTLIIRKINLISEDFRSLKLLTEMSLESYKEDPVNEVLAERYLERMIGRMIDINYHLITELDNPPPKDYYESFIILGRLKDNRL
ncbi:MAG: HepT-like ribonuclease domain-containing protein [Nitrospirota bacterium]